MHDDYKIEGNDDDVEKGDVYRWAGKLANAAWFVGLFSRSICSTILLPNRFFISFRGFNRRLSTESRSEMISFGVTDASCWDSFDTIKNSSSI